MKYSQFGKNDDTTTITDDKSRFGPKWSKIRLFYLTLTGHPRPKKESNLIESNMKDSHLGMNDCTTAITDDKSRLGPNAEKIVYSI